MTARSKITERTVAFHKYRVMEELDLATSAELVQFAIRSRILVRCVETFPK